MPGRHAPKSPLSFYVSLGRAAAGVVGAVALVAVLAVVAFGNRGAKKPDATGGVPGTPAASVVSSPSVSPSPTPSSSVRAASSVTVVVLNGAGRPGLAGKTKPKVAAEGYKVLKIGNARATKVSTIFYEPGYREEALALQQAFPGFTQVKPADNSIAPGANLTLVLGADYPK
jgi:LytR cell envelope-related transcriptional attenuator